MPAGTVISNAATIVFDFNAPLVTDPGWWNTVEWDPPGAVSGGFPSNQTTTISLQPTLSWDAAALAQSSDIYLWRTNDAKPATPSLSGQIGTQWIRLRLQELPTKHAKQRERGGLLFLSCLSRVSRAPEFRLPDLYPGLALISEK